MFFYLPAIAAVHFAASAALGAMTVLSAHAALRLGGRRRGPVSRD